MKIDRTQVAFGVLMGSAVGATVYAIHSRMEPRESFAMGTIKMLLRLKGKGGQNNVKALTALYRGRSYPPPVPIPRRLHKRCDIREEWLQGQSVFTLTPKDRKSDLHIIYTPGGGYVNPLQAAHWDVIGCLIEKTGATVTVPIYPLAPEHTYQATYSLLEAVYRKVTSVTPPDRVVLCGDSAGGGLALGQALNYRDKGLPLPGRLVLFSPWLDITMSNPGAAPVEKDDVMLGLPALVQCGRWWAGEDDPESPLLSPLLGDLSGLPPIDVFQGTHDVFLADARALKEKVASAGGKIHLYEYPGAFHVFVTAIKTPEAKDVFARVAMALKPTG